MSEAAVVVMFSTGHRSLIASTVHYTETLTASVAGVTSCSYKGGCPLTLTGTNIGLSDDLVVRLEGYECVRKTTS